MSARIASIVAALALVFVFALSSTPTYAADNNGTFDGTGYLVAHGADPAGIHQVFNPDNGKTSQVWSYNGPAVDLSDLPQGVTASRVGDTLIISAVPFDGEQFLVAHGARPDLGDVVVQIVNPDNGETYKVWSYKGQALDLDAMVFPNGVTLHQIGDGAYILSAN